MILRPSALVVVVTGVLSCASLMAGGTTPSTDPVRAPAPGPGDTETHTIPGTAVQFDVAFVPGGTFLMGSPDDEEGRDADEGPRRTVTVSPFWMGINEVTFDEYAVFRFVDRDADTTAVPGAIYEADAVARPSPPYEDPAHGLGNEGYPAAGMTQWGALHYARWLSEKTGVFFRLPTEAEWEFACRAGSDDPPTTGIGFDRSVWYLDNSGETFQPVGAKRANAFGLHDMLGNVAEWTLDQYTATYFSDLAESGATDPWELPTSLHPRTVRGGAFDDYAEDVRCSARLESSLNWKRRDPQIPKSFWWNTDSPFVGFRLIRPVDQPAAEDREMFWIMVLGE